METARIENGGDGVITYASETHRLRIFMKGLLHLDLHKQFYAGLQSYIDTKYFSDRNHYCIDIHQHGNTAQLIEVGYVDRSQWERILKIIEVWANRV